jgi:threonyl-tRNA synthetase
MQRRYPELKKVMGPPIEDGFYFDFDLDYKVTPEDLPNIEADMQKMIAADLPIVRKEVSADEAAKLFANNQYKLATLAEIQLRGEKVSIYSTGTPDSPYYDVDLCSGPHVESTGKIKAFKLLSLAGAYYKGNEKNKMLQRIYGTAFDSQEALDEHLTNMEEAKKRDHRKLGPELGLFMFHETAPGEPYWLPNGTILLNELINFWRVEHAEKGYKEISSPLVNKKELWELSGHWEHYKDDMFIADMGEGEIYGIKPMNCPNAMIVFGSQTRSYKDLPLRLSDTDCLHRYERSGTLNGLLRARSFRQDDSHNFITEDQIEAEYDEIFGIVDRFYGVFDLDYSLRLGTRPESFMGDIETWNKAEKALHTVLEKKVGKGNYLVLEGDGAFYGPKVDILMKDVLGREWQMGTIQLDFQIPRNFNLKYTDSDGSQKTPVVIHRVVYGSLERFVGIIIEHFAGAFPVWLSPVQVAVIPVSEKNNDYANKVAKTLKELHIRVEIDTRDETMQAKIRDAQMHKVPYMLILGAKEETIESVNVRLRDGTPVGLVKLAEFAHRASQKYLTKALDLW